MIAAITFIQCQRCVPKGLCLVSNEWKKKVPCSYWKLSHLFQIVSVWNRGCVWAVEVAAVMLCFGYNGNLQSSLCLESRLNNPWLDMPVRRQDNRRKPCPLCSLLRDAHEQSPKGTKPEWISKCFPFMKCLLLYILAVPLYLYTTKPLDRGYLIRKKYCTFNFYFYFKFISKIKSASILE